MVASFSLNFDQLFVAFVPPVSIGARNAGAAYAVPWQPDQLTAHKRLVPSDTPLYGRTSCSWDKRK